MKKTISRLFSGVLAVVMAVGMLPAFAELDAAAEVDVVDSHGTSEATVIDVVPAQFNVIVPTKLPFAILANNATLKATNAAIKNNSNGPVVLAGITAEGKGWAFADYDGVDFDKMPMNSKVFTMQLNGDKVPEAAVDTKVNVPITQSAWASGAEGSIYGKSDLAVSYDGKFAPQADAADEAVVAHVVFTIGWQTADAEPSAPAFDASTFDFSVSDWPAAAADELYTYSVADNKVTITGVSEKGKAKDSITDMPDTIDGVPVTSIGNEAFAHTDGQWGGCKALALTSLPAGLTSIGVYAFSHCTNLALTSLPAGVTSIGIAAFYNCTNLALTSLPAGLIGFGHYAFWCCTSLALTSLPNGVTYIGEGAFYHCTNVNIQTAPCSYGEDAFEGTKCENPTVK